jgi:hypothetical protein
MAARAAVQYSASQVENGTNLGMTEAASTTAPCIKIRYPPVDLPVSGQSLKDESEKTMMGKLPKLSFPVRDKW